MASLAAALGAEFAGAQPWDMGTGRELFVDDALIAGRAGRMELRMHHPTPREIALVTGEPWEGNGTNYVTVFRDGDRYRMFYRGSHFSYTGGKDRPNHRDLYCYAESRDGVAWSKPELGLFAWEGSKKNNIVWDGPGSHAFVPFCDANPACKPEAKYKALGVGGEGAKHGLYAFASPDAIHWSLLRPEPVITRGDFDSQNLAFWDAQRGQYREYHRQFRNGRDIRTATSKDFLHWTEPELLTYRSLTNPAPGEGAGATVPDVKDPVGASYPPGRVSELYTNQILPYYRAAHILLGFPTRYIDRGWTESAKALPRYDFRQVRAKESRREGTAVTDGMLMVSRDRRQFAVWPESFIRPGLRTRDTWFYGDCYQAWGLVETRSPIDDAPAELSLYATECAGQDQPARLRRYTLRIDGFVSAHAPLAGGELITRPLVFRGRRMVVNYSTSAAGSLMVEIQDAQGKPIPGYALADAQDLYGDSLEQAVLWKAGGDVSKLAGREVRLRFVLKDADLYSFQFPADDRAAK
jgi:hypothetical protein